MLHMAALRQDRTHDCDRGGHSGHDDFSSRLECSFQNSSAEYLGLKRLKMIHNKHVSTIPSIGRTT